MTENEPGRKFPSSHWSCRRVNLWTLSATAVRLGSAWLGLQRRVPPTQVTSQHRLSPICLFFRHLGTFLKRPTRGCSVWAHRVKQTGGLRWLSWISSSKSFASLVSPVQYKKDQKSHLHHQQPSATFTELLMTHCGRDEDRTKWVERSLKTHTYFHLLQEKLIEGWLGD